MKIPELERTGITCEESFRIILTTLKYEVMFLKGNYNSSDINSVKDYSLVIAERIVKTADSLHSVIERDRDNVIANMIIRSMADSISSFILIYREEDINVKLLRHYLYIIDGLQNRINQLSNNPTYNESISKEDYEKLCLQVKAAKQNYQEACNFSVCQIKSLPIYANNKMFIDKLIEGHNWRFQSLRSSPKSRFSWEKMYDLMGFKCPSSFFSSLSDYVHGLSTSNLNLEMEDELFDPVYSFGISLLGKLMSSLKDIFPDEFSSILSKTFSSVLCDQNIPKHYIQKFLQGLNFEYKI